MKPPWRLEISALPEDGAVREKQSADENVHAHSGLSCLGIPCWPQPGTGCKVPCLMFETIQDQLTAAGDKLAHLRRFL